MPPVVHPRSSAPSARFFNDADEALSPQGAPAPKAPHSRPGTPMFGALDAPAPTWPTVDPRTALPEPVVPNPLRGPSPGAMSPQSRQMLTALTAALSPNRSSPIVSADAR